MIKDVDPSSFCPSKYSVLSFAESFSTLSNELLKNTSLLLPVNSLLFNPQQSSPLCYTPPRMATGWLRIRYFGLLANRHRTQLLALCRSLLQTSPPSPIAASLGHLCQHCHRGTMRVVEYLSPAQVSAWLDAPQPENSS